MTRDREPEWVIIGSKNREGGYRVFASADLNQTELDRIRFTSVTRLSNLPGDYIEFRTSMGYVRAADGVSYSDALFRLFEGWDPDRPAMVATAAELEQ